MSVLKRRYMSVHGILTNQGENGMPGRIRIKTKQSFTLISVGQIPTVKMLKSQSDANVLCPKKKE